jgi:hypothetical protein
MMICVIDSMFNQHATWLAKAKKARDRRVNRLGVPGYHIAVREPALLRAGAKRSIFISVPADWPGSCHRHALSRASVVAPGIPLKRRRAMRERGPTCGWHKMLRLVRRCARGGMPLETPDACRQAMSIGSKYFTRSDAFRE